MIKPTIGRVVLVNTGEISQSQWWPGTIVYIYEDDRINVAGLNLNGDAFCERGIELRQGEVTNDPIFIPSNLCGERFACWMPYQREQAAKPKPDEAEKIRFRYDVFLGAAIHGLLAQGADDYHTKEDIIKKARQFALLALETAP